MKKRVIKSKSLICGFYPDSCCFFLVGGLVADQQRLTNCFSSFVGGS
jgi:hypothetical protein